MSGSIGANRIPRAAVETTLKSYIEKVLRKFPGFKSAKISGSYNTSVKPDHGDIDLVIHIEGDEFFIDLVFFNRLLQCFVLIEIKTEKLTHQDIGQLQMYVNYYDRFEKQEFEQPTIGILLCTDKNDAMVKITLPENNSTIIASKYQLYLPTEKQLIEEVQKEIQKLDAQEKE